MIQTSSLLVGELMRLIPFSADSDPISCSKWNRNSEYLHLSIADPCKQYSFANIKKWFEENELSDEMIYFKIQSSNEERIIGNINLEGFKGNFINVFVGISVGDTKDWGKVLAQLQ